ncbi:MAG: hypothetical protein JO171_00925, partial [Paludibacterium sp.]|uniref:hypothetical protein n=1 Tax=Paludibacterium sp. TaxID=1917523 RepID=UPI0025FCE513
MSMTAATSEHPEGFPHDQGAGGGGVPSPGPDSKASIHDGGQYPSTPAGYTEINGSGATYSAQRLGTTLLIRAQGMLPYLNEVADIRQAPLRISPPAFDFLIYKPQILAPAL